MGIQFTKMHGLGNDFMVIDSIRQTVNLSAKQISFLAQRHTGIGFDQCLLIEASTDPRIDFSYRIFNADGTEVGQCGNGARCLARYVRYYGLTNKDNITIATPTTKMELQIHSDESVSVLLEQPKFTPAEIPLLFKETQKQYEITYEGNSILFYALNVGNPHVVLIVNDVQNAPVATLGQFISEYPLFPEQTNVGFMEIINPEKIRLRVYERGCGETTACGSGAVAAVAAGRKFEGLAPEVQVELPGGILKVSWPEFDSRIALTGAAVFVYEGLLCE